MYIAYKKKEMDKGHTVYIYIYTYTYSQYAGLSLDPLVKVSLLVG